MMKMIRLSLALATGALASTAFAATSSVALSPEATASHLSATLDTASRARLPAPNQAGPKAMGQSTVPGTPHANAFRAYPPSCAADPLPDAASGPTWTARVPAYAYSAINPRQGFQETVTVTLWRLACSSSGDATIYNPNGLTNAITLMRIDRDAGFDATHILTFPLIEVSQGGSAFGGNASIPRIAIEPNTFVSEVGFNSAVVTDGNGGLTYVLENYPYDGFGYFSYSDAFTIRLDPVIQGVSTVDILVPNYDSTQYPDATAPLFLDGYAAAQWYNADRGDGLLVQVSEASDAQGSVSDRQLVFDLLTKDATGGSIWLLGNASFPPYVTSVTVGVNYLGDYNGTAPTLLPWGNATFSLKDCNNLDVTFTPNAGLPTPVPSFTGTIPYTRLFSANGMLCE